MAQQPPPDSFSLPVTVRNDPDEARRLQDLINCLDFEIDQANDVLRELLKRRSTLLAEASYIPCDRDDIIRDMRQLDSELVSKQIEIANTQAELVQMQEHAQICYQQQNSPGQSPLEYASPSCPPHPHNHQQEIYQCQLVLDRLTQELNRIQQQLDHSRKLLSPILRLPSELLQHIFTFCIPSQKFVPLYQQSAPLLLTSVNRLFRERALATPQLWSSLSIHRNSSGTGFYPHPNLIQLFIERSAAIPLSWSLEDARPSLTVVDTNRPPMPVSQIVELYVPHAERWKHVRIDYGSGWVPNTGLDSLPANIQFPWLETLSIKRGYWLDNREISILSRMLTSPRLHGVSWYSQKPYTTLTMPWSQLRQFSINHLVPVREALNIISRCERLEEVEMNILLPSKVDDESPIEILRHDTLQAFKVEAAGDPNVLFSLITFPGLKRLEITLTQGPRLPPMSLPLLRQFIDRSSCVLEKFSMEEAQLNSDDLLEFLKFISPSLLDISFQHERSNAGYINDKILRMLTQTDIHGPNYIEDPTVRGTFSGILCPNLRYLRLWGVVGSTDGVLADMLESRWLGCRNCRPGEVLDTAFVVLDDDMDQNRHQEDFRRMHELKARRPGLCFQRLVRVVMDERAA
ncbi:hypothetical protein D9756_003543 [Leucocoprinus leucothites]|uniref:F-box domain-containing protein n=1 Tax=Leucocoprinus leucothites TaxID=201217 RepID=A0A8H5G7B7_9AGAR|nr:hypothetical protein D9756_003543 [Leucoagaricus leucothites]